MSNRILSLATLALTLFVGATALTAKEAETATHEGKFVSITGDKLVMTGNTGETEHSHILATDAKVTCDGVVCKTEALKAGTRIRVTTSTTKAGKQEATRIEAIDKNESFAAVDDSHEGTFVSITGNKLVMTNREGLEHSHLVPDDAKVTCDKLSCKLSDLKAGMRIRVFSQSKDKTVVTRIEAINKDPAFAVVLPRALDVTK